MACGSESFHFVHWLVPSRSPSSLLLSTAPSANFPDIDVVFARIPGLGGYYNFHRTATHSLYGNAFIVPALSVLLWLTGTMHLALAFVLVTLCIASHLVTDWITNYVCDAL